MKNKKVKLHKWLCVAKILKTEKEKENKKI